MPSTHSNLEIPLSERPHPTLLPILNQKSLESSIPAELLQPYLDHLSTPLQPLVSCIEGRVHSDFPRTLLQYHLLTSTQLDNLAWHFHQISPPIPESAYYPIRVTPWLVSRQNIDLETKRRRFGRFIGLQGCDSPVQGQGVPWEYNPALDSNARAHAVRVGGGVGVGDKRGRENRAGGQVRGVKQFLRGLFVRVSG